MQPKCFDWRAVKISCQRTACQDFPNVFGGPEPVLVGKRKRYRSGKIEPRHTNLKYSSRAGTLCLDATILPKDTQAYSALSNAIEHLELSSGVVLLVWF